MNKKKVYVGCAINGLVEPLKSEYLANVERIKDKLRDQFEVLDFAGTAEGSAQDVYEHDINKCVAEADYMLAMCDYPSTGLGYEMATALEKRRIPVIAFAHKDSSVSRLILGICGKKYSFERYDSLDSVANTFIEIIASVEALNV